MQWSLHKISTVSPLCCDRNVKRERKPPVEIDWSTSEKNECRRATTRGMGLRCPTRVDRVTAPSTAYRIARSVLSKEKRDARGNTDKRG